MQFIDVNGDGFTDLLRGGISDQAVLLNDGRGDWTPAQDLAGSPAWTGGDADLRFLDYDNDMDIDLIRSNATQTFVFENDGSFAFERRDLSPLGVAFSENVQFADMNGDGLLEVVRLQANQLQYKTNFGRGRFAEAFTTMSHPFGAGEAPLALVEDLDGDGYADIVVASGSTVRYVLNRNGERFEAVETVREVYHYDGEAFVGLPEGQLTQGKLTRVMHRADDDKQIPVVRSRFDAHGNAIETLDPLGAPGGPTHRRAYTYATTGCAWFAPTSSTRPPTAPPTACDASCSTTCSSTR